MLDKKGAGAGGEGSDLKISSGAVCTNCGVGGRPGGDKDIGSGGKHVVESDFEHLSLTAEKAALLRCVNRWMM